MTELPPRKRHRTGRSVAVLREPLRSELLQFAATGVPDKLLAEACGVAASTFCDWRRRGAEGDRTFAEFFGEIERARARASVALVGRIVQAAQTDWKAARYLLACRHPEMSERRALDAQVSGHTTVRVDGQLDAALTAALAVHAPALALVPSGALLTEDAEDDREGE